MNKIPLFLLLAVAAMPAALHADSLIDPSRTYAVIAGVLRWQDRGLAPYATEMRKDRELHARLLSMGVPARNTVLLLDERCTLKNMREAVSSIAAKAGPGSTLIFYYAGHGIREKEGIYFANYDISTADRARTGFALSSLPGLITGAFRGSRVLLMADCCYSGGLAGSAAAVAAKKFGAASLTSAESSNVSSGNWTFTQTVIDCLSGNPLADRDRDGAISLDEAAAEVRDAMKYRERQRMGYYAAGIAGSATLARARSRPTAGTGSAWKPGDYVLAPYGGRNCVGRITGGSGGSVAVEFFFYNRKERADCRAGQLKKMTFRRFPAGGSVSVTWGNNTYPAKILKTDGDFHLITYPGWPDYWNEWVLDDRILPQGSGKAVSVLWQGAWYPAVILKEEKGKYYIRYTGYDSSWDEWVGPDRIRK